MGYDPDEDRVCFFDKRLKNGLRFKPTFQSIEYLSKKDVYVPKSRKRKFDNRVFIRPTGRKPTLGNWYTELNKNVDVEER